MQSVKLKFKCKRVINDFTNNCMHVDQINYQNFSKHFIYNKVKNSWYF